jgi:hypothetical protein
VKRIIAVVLPFLAATFLPAAALADTLMQAENMTPDAGTSSSVYNDGSVVTRAFWANGGANASYVGTATRLELRARGQQCEGAPRAVVLVDGVQRASFAVSATSYATYSQAVSLPDGNHTVRLAFTNDHGTSYCNRNLFADWVRVVGVPSGPTPPSGSVYFSDTFDRDADTFVPPWYWTIQAAPDRLQTVSSPVRKGSHSLKMTVPSSDNPNGWGSRADVYGPTTGAASVGEGDERWVGWSLYLPSNFQSQLTSRGWILLAEHGYATYLQPRVAYYFIGGPVGSGASVFELEIRPGSSNTPTTIFAMQPTYGVWMDVVAHYKFSTNPSVGYVELWVNGQQKTFSNGSQRYYTNTLEPGAPNRGKIQHANYRAAGSMGSSITLYQDEIKMGGSYAAVAP